MYVDTGSRFLWKVSLSALEAAYAAETHAKAKLRLQCALLRKKGKSQPFIAEVTGLPVTTVSGILRRFSRRGLSACHAIKQAGQPKHLTVGQEASLRRIVKQSPEKSGLPFVIWTTKLVHYVIKKRFGVDFVSIQIHRLLKRFGLSRQQARPEHIKANKRLQKKWKKNFNQDFATLELVDLRSSFWTNAHSHSNPTKQLDGM